jgi:hypothetical protein
MTKTFNYTEQDYTQLQESIDRVVILRNDKDIHPMTEVMMKVAQNPNDPWLKLWAEKHNKSADHN